jgi:hypothetical protein
MVKVLSVVVLLLAWLCVAFAVYAVSDCFWSFWLMHATHWAGAENWTFGYTITHWGALCPFVLG